MATDRHVDLVDGRAGQGEATLWGESFGCIWGSNKQGPLTCSELVCLHPHFPFINLALPITCPGDLVALVGRWNCNKTKCLYGYGVFVLY